MKQFKRLLVVVGFTTLSLQAGSFSYTAVTTGAPTFNRPYDNGTTAPPTLLSAIGTAVRYTSQSFIVSTAGSYSVTSISVTPVNWDGMNMLTARPVKYSDPTSNARFFSEALKRS